jgi:hypothetical protein
MACFEGPSIVRDNLVFHLDAGNTKSYPGTGSTWSDLSGYGNNGTFSGSTVYSSVNGGALSFNGGTDSVYASGIISGQQYTWAAWINSSSIANDQNILSMNGPYFMRITGSTVRFNILTSGGWLFQQGTTILSSNTWYYLTMVFDSANGLWKGYINGVPEFSVSKTGTQGYGSFYVYIGYTPQGGENAPFYGKIATIQYYNASLTNTQILQNYNAHRSRFT